MLTRILNYVLWIDTVFSRSTDPMVAEYRACQRHLIGSGATLLLVLCATFVITSYLDSDNRIVQEVSGMLGRAFALLAALCVAWCARAAYQLWRVERNEPSARYWDQ